jgi:ribosomal protein S18 acetylase RimI-like enzyme
MTYTIEALTPVPEHVLGTREEANLLTYGPSKILLAKYGEEIVGAVRFALRQDVRRLHGLIADLSVHEDYARQGIEDSLIVAAEERLKAQGVTKIDAIVRDGEGATVPYYERGYWAARKMVLLTWDLEALGALEIDHEFTITEQPDPDPEFLADFILNSYQPYWRWWKEYKEDTRWHRVEYPAEPEAPPSEALGREMRTRVEERVAAFGSEATQTLFIARLDGEVVGLCDAKAATDDVTFDWGLLVRRDFGGRRIGTALLWHALKWLKTQGLDSARIITTSGLDDYDPTVYLYSFAHGGTIRAEYLNLVKRRLHTTETGDGNKA